MSVYITGLSSFLPNTVVTNDDMERMLGFAGGHASKSRRIVLRHNKILSRYYAIDPVTLMPTHSNAQLTALAIRKLFNETETNLDSFGCLSCGTSSPDHIFPGHAVMVHGELGGKPIETASAAGVCACGVTALKYASMSILTGQCDKAIATGSELFSSFLRGAFFNASEEKTDQLEKTPSLAFDADFLRWMLSDGAGAALLSSSPATTGLSLKIDWIESYSHAGTRPVCMYSGALRKQDGSLEGWRNVAAQSQSELRYALAMKQDTVLIDKALPPTGIDTVDIIKKKHGIQSHEIDWFLPHLSSFYFEPILEQGLAGAGLPIPRKKWYTNLSTVGNVGAASIYLMLAELFNNGRFSKGQRILCYIPESGRFTHCFIQLTVV